MHHTRDGINIYNHTPQKRATFLAFHQQAAEQLRRNLLGGAGEEGWGGGDRRVLVAMGVA